VRNFDDVVGGEEIELFDIRSSTHAAPHSDRALRVLHLEDPVERQVADLVDARGSQCAA
jgi:hypothetical protein